MCHYPEDSSAYLFVSQFCIMGQHFEIDQTKLKFSFKQLYCTLLCSKVKVSVYYICQSISVKSLVIEDFVSQNIHQPNVFDHNASTGAFEIRSDQCSTHILGISGHRPGYFREASIREAAI